MHLKDGKARFLVAIIVTVSLMATACTNTQTNTDIRYEKLDISAESIRESIKPGDRIQLETEHLVARIRVTGYKEDKYLVGVDEFSDQEVLIAFTDLEDVHILKGMRGKEVTNVDPSTGGTASEAIFWSVFIPVAIVTAPIWHPMEKATEKARVENEREAHEKYSEQQFLTYAQDALSRGDLEAAYRLLEDGLISDHAEVREKFKLFLGQHPEIHQGARHSFTSESFKKSIGMYGEAAQEIENQRLSIYKTVVPVHEYQKARNNYESVFGSTN